MKLKVSQIRSNPDNPRTIRDDRFKKLVQSLKDFPEMAEVREVVVNKDYMILGGNMRFKAMQEAGWKDIPVKVVDWSLEKQKEFIIKDNVSGGDWDWDLLANEWDSDLLDDWGLDLPTGFGQEEVVEDEAPPVADIAVSKLGEIYQLGRHRLMCGDSTDFGSVSDLMDGKQADMVFTDPPYNLSFNGGSRKEKFATLINDDISTEDWDTFIDTSLTNMSLVCSGAVYICIDWRNYSVVFPKMEKLWKIYNCVVWVKNQLSMGMRYRFRHEFIIYADNTNWQGGHSLTDVWDENKDAYKEYKHPTQKPIDLIARAVNNSSKKDDSVLDLFGGSGSTLIACEQLDRTCYMMELDPKYCDVIRKRYAKFIGEEDWINATPVIS